MHWPPFFWARPTLLPLLADSIMWNHPSSACFLENSEAGSRFRWHGPRQWKSPASNRELKFFATKLRGWISRKNTYINHMEIIWKSYGNHMKSFYNPFIIQWTLFVAPGLSFVPRIREKSNQAPLGARRCAANPCSALLLWPKEADFLGKRILLQNWIPFWTPTVG